MPFGVKNVPAVFQREMNRVLSPVLNRCALVYIDDIIMYSPDFDSHMKDCAEVLTLITCSGMTLKPKKCHFGYRNIEALGHRISHAGIHTSPDKVTAVTEFKAPNGIGAVRTFLGLTGYYRKFIQNYATIARPLTELTKKGCAFTRGPRQQNAFDILKKCLCQEPILAAPDFSLPFIIYTDASSFELRAVLAQVQGGEERVVCYLSRQTKDAESRYTPTELECLAVVWALDHLSVYVHGHPFTLRTDHSALRQLFSLTPTNRRLAKWSLQLQDYRDWMTIEHRAGKSIGLVTPV